MKKIYSLAVIVLLMGLTGCLSTVYPIFTEKDVVFDPKLIGKWTEGDKSGDVVEITKATDQELNEIPSLRKLADKVYMIRYRNGKNRIEGAYFGFLVKLGNKFYVDYFPAETATGKEYDGFYKSHFTRMHTCYSIRFVKDNNTFELKQFDENYMQQLIETKQIRIRHETRENGTFVITAPTEELQQYILKYSDIPEAYYKDNSTTYSRILNY